MYTTLGTWHRYIRANNVYVPHLSPRQPVRLFIPPSSPAEPAHAATPATMQGGYDIWTPAYVHVPQVHRYATSSTYMHLPKVNHSQSQKLIAGIYEDHKSNTNYIAT